MGSNGKQRQCPRCPRSLSLSLLGAAAAGGGRPAYLRKAVCQLMPCWLLHLEGRMTPLLPATFRVPCLPSAHRAVAWYCRRPCCCWPNCVSHGNAGRVPRGRWCGVVCAARDCTYYRAVEAPLEWPMPTGRGSSKARAAAAPGAEVQLEVRERGIQMREPPRWAPGPGALHRRHGCLCGRPWCARKRGMGRDRRRVRIKRCLSWLGAQRNCVRKTHGGGGVPCCEQCHTTRVGMLQE